MPQTIDWLAAKETKHLSAWILSSAITTKGREFFDQLDSSNVNISLTIDGVEVDFLKLMDRIDMQLEDIEARGFNNGVESASRTIASNVERILEDLERR